MKKLTFAVAILLLTVVLGACTDKTDSSHDAKQDEEQMVESLSVKDFAGTWVMSINEAHYTVLIKDDGTGVVTTNLLLNLSHPQFMNLILNHLANIGSVMTICLPSASINSAFMRAVFNRVILDALPRLNCSRIPTMVQG